jgi:predicted RNase H-like nuclease (RuvC/YqgF family)
MTQLINYPEWGKKMGLFVSRKTHEFELYKQRVRNEMSELMDKVWDLEAKIEKLEDKINEMKGK